MNPPGGSCRNTKRSGSYIIAEPRSASPGCRHDTAVPRERTGCGVDTIGPVEYIAIVFAEGIRETRDDAHLEGSRYDMPTQMAVPPRTRLGGGIQVNPDLRNLIALQDLDQKIARIQKEISEVPAKVQNLQVELQAITEAHQKAAARNQELAKKRRAREGEVDLMRAKLSRLKDQLMSVKTNKEYTAMLHEIQAAEDQIRTAEDEILDIMEALESMEKDLKQGEKTLKTRTAEIQQAIAAAEASVPLLEKEAQELQERRQELERLIPEELLERYRRIAELRKGIALAEAKDELCSMCHVRIRPQVYADLRQGENIHSCESCSRILFLRNAG